MSKKSRSFNSFENLGGLVYSTGNKSEYEENEPETPEPGDQYLEAHLEKKGRGGKTAIIIKGFRGPEDELKDLAKNLKGHCATGGSVKDGEIIIQGNMREKAMEFLKNIGYHVKRVGG